MRQLLFLLLMNQTKLFKYISFKKVYNIICVYLGYQLSSIFKTVILWGYPYSLTTEPTNRCNLNCLECPSGNNSSKAPKGEMDFEKYKKIIDDVKNYIIFQMLYFQGEPFLHAGLFKMIKYSDDNRIYSSISTNGHFLTAENNIKIIKSGLKRIIISVDGVIQESYEKYRVGGNLNTVLKGIEDLVEAKRKSKSIYPKIIIQFLMFRHNEHEIPKIKALCKELSVDKLEFKSAQINNFKNFVLIPKINKYARYKKHNSNYLIKSKLKNKCLRIWSTMVITQDGSLIPCCFDKNNKYKIGNIINSDTLKLWESDTFKNFRQKILKNRKSVEMCCNCSEGLSK
ncbi:MAG: radical SAM protein [Bacteroidales bacterium]|nr:radical SAM protein [Bacteroidales bacterium]